MPNTYANIIAKIKAMLQALEESPGVPLFGQILDYGEAEFTAYPAAVILDRAGNGEVIDTHRNEREFIFRILLYQEQSAAGKTKAEAAAKMRACVDAVMAKFDQNINMDGVVARVRVIPVAFEYTQRTGTFNFATIDLVAVDLVNNYGS